MTDTIKTNPITVQDIINLVELRQMNPANTRIIIDKGDNYEAQLRHVNAAEAHLVQQIQDREIYQAIVLRQ
jgi:hypothetical protein